MAQQQQQQQQHQNKDKMSEIDEHIMKRFDIQKRLGKGAYGIVWKAIDRKTKEVVAVKKIFDAFRNQTDAQRTFREIMFLQSFKNHPNIVKLHSIHRAANNRDIYLGFEYMETDLHNVIKRGKILKDVHRRYIMYQLLKAIKYIHSGNVIHRDMKPSNVLLDSLCRCKIADFGLARSVTQHLEGNIGEGDPTLTDYVATRWYRAPEILIANRRYTKGIDMWSLGCILAEMLAGKPIFPGTSTVNQVEKIMATIPTPTQEDINSVCISGVGSCMIKNASTVPKVPLKQIIGSNLAEDSLELVAKLLVFNPLKRLTAEQALDEEYVGKFHDPDQEVVMNSNVVIPLNDDIRLSVSDYRNKLYEVMSQSTRPRGGALCRSKLKHETEVQSGVSKITEKYMKTRYSVKEKQISYSDSKINNATNKNQNNHGLNASNISSDSKVVRPNTHLHNHQEQKIFKACGDFNHHKGAPLKSTSELHSYNHNQNHDKSKKRIYNSKSSIHNSFNSLSATHGIITQSALLELRAAGLR